MARLEAIFDKLPHLPKKLVDFLVKIIPWFALIGGVLSLLSGLIILKLFMVRAIFSIVSGILLIIAFKPLKARKIKGWMYLFWVAVIGLLEVAFLGALLWQIIGFYLLFEVKKSYDHAS